MIFVARLIGRAGLATDAVTGHLAVFAGTLRHDILQALPDIGGGFRADDLANRGRVMALLIMPTNSSVVSTGAVSLALIMALAICGA